VDEHYERILLNIDGLYYDIANKVFQWLCFSTRSLQLREVGDISAIDLDSKQFVPTGRIGDLADLHTVCSTLVTLTTAKHDEDYENDQQRDGYQQFELAHSSVKDYLVSDRIMQSKARMYGVNEKAAHASISESCVIYLLQLGQYEIFNDHILEQLPLAKYSAQFWAPHAQRAYQLGHSGDLTDLILRLFSSKRAFRRVLQIFNPENHYDIEAKEITPLYYAARFGLEELVKCF
jgi:hypothetical protein